MDSRDLRLIARIREEGIKRGRFSLTGLARAEGITHVAAGKRLRRLVEREEYRLVPEINLGKLGCKVALINVEVPGYAELARLEDIYAKCPRTIWMMESIGAYSLIVMMYAENDGVLKSILTGCSVRTRAEVRKSEVEIGDLVGGYAPIQPPIGGDLEVAPCGADCGRCIRYSQGMCIGCPATTKYRGADLKGVST